MRRRAAGAAGRGVSAHHDTPSRPTRRAIGAARAMPSERRPRLGIRPAQAASSGRRARRVGHRTAAASGQRDERDDRPDPDADRDQRARCSAARRTAGSRHVSDDHRADDRPARSTTSNSDRPSRRPTGADAARDQDHHESRTRRGDALVRLGRMRRQGRRERAPRAGPEVGRRPGGVAGRPLPARRRGPSSACRRRGPASSGSAAACPSARPARPSSDATYDAGEQAADDAERELHAAEAGSMISAERSAA